tara:strand:+ start:43813 stop:45333 length:1521 start_codon:yes stop_codon:yes gene_type:complete
MKFSKIREHIYNSKIQVVKINEEGIILESEDTIFKMKKDSYIGKLHPFLEGIEPLFSGPNPANTKFPCVNLEINDKPIIADIQLLKEENEIFVVFFDFTEHYTDSHPLVQEKNEASITKNKLTFEKNLLLAKEEIKNKFIAHLNHEIRNPLNSLLGFMEILKKSKLDYEQQETLKIMGKTGTHLKVLLDDLLDISRIEKGETELRNIPFSLSQILNSLLKHFQLKYDRTGIELDIDMNKEVPIRLLGDPTRLNQIIYNLIENAFKNTDKGSIIITVTSEKLNEQDVRINFRIADTGRGIPKKDLPKIFDSYYQLEFKETVPLGEGLGLKIVKELTHLLNGKITVDSRENIGTTYTVNLPFKVRKKKEPKKKTVPKGTGIVLSKRILIAENDEISQMLYMKTFLDNDEGYYIEFARDGRHAIDLIDRRSYDLILLKMKLPDLNGFKLMEYIRSNSNTAIGEIPILVVTGSTMKEEETAILDAGASAFLAKPYTQAELYKKIDQLLKE